MKKTISLVLCVVMLLSLLPLSAFATELIHRVPVFVETPYAGNSVNFYAEIEDEESDGVCIDTGFYSEGVYNGVKWIDVTPGIADGRMMEGDSFIEGHSYEVTVYVRANRGYAFEKDEAGEPAFWAAVNNQVTAYVYEEFDNYSLSQTFVCEKDKMRILSAAATVTPPTAGNKPSFNATPADSTKYEICHDNDNNWHVFNGVQWREVISGTFLTPDSVFTTDGVYEVSVYLQPKAGYAFATNNFQDPETATIQATINGVKAETNGRAEECAVWAQFACGGAPISTKINEVRMYGTAPVVGAKPNYNITLAKGARYRIDTDYNDSNHYNGVAWFDANSLEHLTPNSTFKKGHTYRVLVFLKPADGCSFPVEDETVTTDVYFNDQLGWVGGGDESYIHAAYQQTMFVDIGEAKVSGFVKSFDYTGQKITQSKMKLTYNGYTLEEGEDYYVTYAANQNVGTATMRIFGQGSFNGNVALSFKIQLAKPKVSVTSVTANTINLKWAKVTGAKYYCVYQYLPASKSYKLLKIITGTACSATKLASGKAYAFLVRAAYTNTSGNMVLSPYTTNDNVVKYTLCAAPVPKAAV